LPGDLLPEDQCEAVGQQGLGALDDSTLTALALNPFALHGLHDFLTEMLPPAWLDDLLQDARRLVSERGLNSTARQQGKDAAS
jgi:hypothetical protein